MKIFLKLLFFIFLNLLVLNSSVFSEEGKIKIGLLAPLTGENSELGRQIIKAVRMALKDIGANQIEIYPKDTASNPKKLLTLH